MIKGIKILGFDGDFAFYGFLYALMLVLVIGLLIYAIVKSFIQWRKNNRSPRLTVQATVATKRSDVTYHHQYDSTGTGIQYTTDSTYYYVTFQMESGDRIELGVPDHEYGMLVEGDKGMLTFQGTRYLGFERS